LNCLFVITARAGSKDIPGKNHKPLGGKPLFMYSFELARRLTTDDNICVSTDDLVIADILANENYELPFIRPSALASDSSGSYEVLLHALAHYEAQRKLYDSLVLLQPTSPFRRASQVTSAISMFSDEIDMVVSVRESKANPYYSLFEEDESGYLKKMFPGNFARRQDIPPVYEYNGAIYVINCNSLKDAPIESFMKVKKYLMDDVTSVDLDTPFDWFFAESLLKYYPDLRSTSKNEKEDSGLLGL